MAVSQRQSTCSWMQVFYDNYSYNEKKCSERCKLCTLAVVRQSQKNSPNRRSPSRGRGTAKNLICWRWSLPSLSNPVCRRSMHAISSFRGNRPTDKHTNRLDRLQYTPPLSLARSVSTVNMYFDMHS